MRQDVPEEIRSADQPPTIDMDLRKLIREVENSGDTEQSRGWADKSGQVTRRWQWRRRVKGLHDIGGGGQVGVGHIFGGARWLIQEERG